MYKHYLAVALVVSLCFGDHANATTVVYAVTSTGMVIGADGKTVPSGTAVKIFLLRKRSIVADIYAETAKSGDSGTVLYDFPAWVKKLDEHTNAKVSVSGLTEIIKDQMTTTFAFAIDAIKSGRLTKEQAVAEGVDAYLVQYIIAGYEKGIPVGYSLTLMPDWETKTVNGPFQVFLKEENGQKLDSYILWRGQGVGIKQALMADTKEQKELAGRIPVEFRALRIGKSLTLNQASNVVRAFLGIEAEANPRYVSFPITVVTIPKSGDGCVRTYKNDTAALSKLPKAKATPGKQKQAK